jgi:hypothetical protein
MNGAVFLMTKTLINMQTQTRTLILNLALETYTVVGLSLGQIVILKTFVNAHFSNTTIRHVFKDLM